MTDYEQFIASKRLYVQSYGPEVAAEAIHPLLFPFQRDLTRWAIRKGRTAIFADTGLGKTFMQLEWARLIGQRALIVAPLSVARQTVREARKLGLAIHYTRSGSDLVMGINITNYEMLDNFDAADFDAVVLDECFAADTEVDVYAGGHITSRPIADVRVGDRICNAAGVDVVADVHRREVPYGVRVSVNGQRIVSSPNHPFFTQRGYVGAQDLEPGDFIAFSGTAVRLVRDAVYAEAQGRALLREVLLSEMADAATGNYREGAFARSGGEAGRAETCLVSGWQSRGFGSNRAHSGPESDGATRSAGESIPPLARDAAQTFRAWGQWHGAYDAASDPDGCIGRRLDGGICLVVGPTNSRLSHALQDRLSATRAESRYRGGWQFALCAEGAGREEGCEAGFARVDGIEILESGHPDLARSRGADGKLYFYDLGATRHPSFSCSGLLVHNSSILKSLDGKTRQRLTEMFAETPYRLCCTATPAPNDIAEIANHAEFLGVMTRADMLATFFVHDDEGWRLKGHAKEPFFKWLASWSMSIRRPSDLGYSDEGYILPALNIRPVWVATNFTPEDQLFYTGLDGLKGRLDVRKATIADKVTRTAELVNASDEQWIIWCGLNEEADALARLIPDSRNVQGSDSAESKAANIEAFQDGAFKVLVTKSKVAGFGMNFQNAHNMVFVGLSDSWEAYYQCIRREYRFGQRNPVNVHIVLTEQEEPIYANVMRKEKEAVNMAAQLIDNVQNFERDEILAAHGTWQYQSDVQHGPDWTVYLGDSAERLSEIADDSVGLSVYSPPFLSLYTYSPTERDLGNSRTADEFFQHYSYIIRHLLRVTMPGRTTCVHVADVPAMLVRDGYIGMKDFPGQTIQAYEREGWVWYGRIFIDKNPQVQALRTKSKALVFQQFEKDSAWSRPAIVDQILLFHKPGENLVPIKPDVTREEWILWARGVWYAADYTPGTYTYTGGISKQGHGDMELGIRETDTLQFTSARSEEDERHICPLQLGTIERCVRLWSNKGETVLSPFAGIGSEGYVSLKHGRKFVGVELKPEYWKQACRNLQRAVSEANSWTLFDAPVSDTVDDYAAEA